MNIEIELCRLPNGKPSTNFHIAVVTDRTWYGRQRERRYYRLAGLWTEPNSGKKAPHQLAEYLEYRLKKDIEEDDAKRGLIRC